MDREPGSGPLGAEAQASWLGHPAQASDFPADSDSGPGQSIIYIYNKTQKSINTENNYKTYTSQYKVIKLKIKKHTHTHTELSKEYYYVHLRLLGFHCHRSPYMCMYNVCICV